MENNSPSNINTTNLSTPGDILCKHRPSPTLPLPIPAGSMVCWRHRALQAPRRRFPPHTIRECRRHIPGCEARSSPHPSALFATVRARPGPFCRHNRLQRRPGGGFDGRSGPGRARTVANSAVAALTGAVRTGREVAARQQWLIRRGHGIWRPAESSTAGGGAGSIGLIWLGRIMSVESGGTEGTRHPPWKNLGGDVP